MRGCGLGLVLGCGVGREMGMWMVEERWREKRRDDCRIEGGGNNGCLV